MAQRISLEEVHAGDFVQVLDNVPWGTMKKITSLARREDSDESFIELAAQDMITEWHVLGTDGNRLPKTHLSEDDLNRVPALAMMIVIRHVKKMLDEVQKAGLDPKEQENSLESLAEK